MNITILAASKDEALGQLKQQMNWNLEADLSNAIYNALSVRISAFPELPPDFELQVRADFDSNFDIAMKAKSKPIVIAGSGMPVV